MSRRRRTQLTAEGLCCLLVMGCLLAGAVIRELNLLQLLFGLMLGAMVWNWRHVVASLRRLEVARGAPRTIAAGEPLALELRARNARRWGTSWAVVVEDTIRRHGTDGAPLHPTVAFARLGAAEESVQYCEGRLARRGRYELGPLEVSTRFPLGLVRRRLSIDAPAVLWVLPRLGRLTERWHDRQGASHDGQQKGSSRGGGVDAEFDSLRDYRAGDSRHLIHWRTSARQGTLMVREFQRPRSRDLALLLDLWQPGEQAQRGEGDPSSAQVEAAIELAVGFAATVVADRCRRGAGRLLLAVSGMELRVVAGAAAPALRQELMEVLALAEATSSDRLNQLLDRSLPQLPAHGDCVLVTTRPDAVNLAAPANDSGDARKAGWLARLCVVSVPSDELRQLFVPS
jgi:uncharacterized protein (DUF58 family)